MDQNTTDASNSRASVIAHDSFYVFIDYTPSTWRIDTKNLAINEKIDSLFQRLSVQRLGTTESRAERIRELVLAGKPIGFFEPKFTLIISLSPDFYTPETSHDSEFVRYAYQVGIKVAEKVYIRRNGKLVESMASLWSSTSNIHIVFRHEIEHELGELIDDQLSIFESAYTSRIANEQKGEKLKNM